MFDVLLSENTINELAEENPSLLKKLLRQLKAFISDIKSIIAQLGNNWAEAKALSKDLQTLESIRWLMESALEDVNVISSENANKSTASDVSNNAVKVSNHGKNVSNTETKNTAIDDGVTKYSKKPTQEQIIDIRTIGRKSVNDFTSGDIKKTEYWARTMYEQLGVKSPFFRAWFGDWRAYDRTPIVVATKKGKNRGPVKNDDTSWNIIVSGKVFDETKVHLSSSVRKAVVFLDYIQDIIKNAVLLDTYVSDKEKENSLFMHSLYAVVNMGNGNEIIKLIVEEMNDPNSEDTNKRAYILRYIKITPTASGRVQNNPSSVTNTANAINTVSNLFSLVKREDESFNPVDIHPSMLNSDGTPMVLYHQTENTFTVFDTKHPGAGTGDYETPFGIFMKPSDADIGLKGQKQMQLYARISNPLIVETREELVRNLKYDKNIMNVLTEIKDTDRKYKKDVDSAIKAFTEYLAEYRKNHPDEPRKKIYDDSRFNELYYKEDEIIEEWSEKINDLALESKNYIVDYLKNNGYDGVILENDVGSFGRSTKTIIALDSTQVKSATDNMGTFDKANPDIRFSYASRKARNSNLAKHAEAVRLESEGHSSEEIRQQTGWFRGYDNKWRFEIDDSRIALRMIKNIPNYTTLGELIVHDKLFEAYPELKDMKVTFQNIEGQRGSYSRSFGDINISRDLKEAAETDSARLLRVLSHEIQHAIQHIEGFARGSSPDYWEDEMIGDDFVSLTKAQRAKFDTLSERYHSIELSEPEFVKEMNKLIINKPNVKRGAIDFETLTKLEEDPPEWKRFDAERSRLEEKYGAKKVFDFLQLDLDIKKLFEGGRTAREMYYDTAGEIEARDTANRMTFDENDRKNTRPDIDREDVVFADDATTSFSLQNIERYSEKEYNDYGWVAVNEVLTGNELKSLNSQFADAKKLNFKYPKSSKNEYMILVGDNPNSYEHLVYIKGDINHPIITQVVGVYSEFEKYKEDALQEVITLNEKENRNPIGIIEGYAGEEIFFRLTLQDYNSYNELQKGRPGTESSENNRGKQDRGRGSESDSEFGIKLSLQKSSDAEKAREKLIRQNKNLRVANMILKQELVQTRGNMLSYEDSLSLARKIKRAFQSSYDSYAFDVNNYLSAVNNSMVRK